MELAILFWFYKEPQICKNRLELIKKYNPDVKIYGLYGGGIIEEKDFKQTLAACLDDFYASPITDPEYKWINGDLMILEWYENHGKSLNWDSVVVVQWDMLIFDNIYAQFLNIEKDQLFLSGLKVLDRKTELSWDWTKPNTKEGNSYLNYLQYIKDKYGYNEPPLCCLFILEVFPRLFFDKYLTVSDREIGMLEYKIPNYAKIFNTPFYEKDVGISWENDSKEKPLNAIPEEIEGDYITKELAKPKGWRIFHPYFKLWDF